MSEAYQPIPCAQHDQLEFSVLRRLMLELEYHRDGEVARREKVCPLDVYTRDGAEWLKFKGGDGIEQAIRLDTIKHFQVLPA